MATIQRFEEIQAWQKGRELRKAVYQCSRRGAFAQDSALKVQIRRAAISVASNIAEGFERAGNREFLQCLRTTKGSCGEVRDQLYVAFDEAYITEKEFKAMQESCFESGRLIAGFMDYLTRTEIRGPKFKTARTSN